MVRLIIPEDLRQSWKEKYNAKTLTVPPSLYDKIHLTVHVEAGKKAMSRARWNNLKKGDYLILDSCTIVPGEEKGRVMLTINQQPYFRAKIKDGSIKILEYPLFYEAGTTMAKETPPNHDEEFVDEELTEDFTEEETEEEDETAEGEHPLPGEAPAAAPTAEASGVPAAQPAVGEKTFKADDIPLDIIVEVGRFQMTIQKLTELKPGNLLDLNIHPENGVNLVVNGTCIAKGELLKIGETFGVRILDIA